MGWQSLSISTEVSPELLTVFEMGKEKPNMAIAGKGYQHPTAGVRSHLHSTTQNKSSGLKVWM
jgi:hypothetical protein